MQAGVTLGLGIFAVLLSASIQAAMPLPVDETKPQSMFPDVAKTPTPGAPVPIPYPNIGQETADKQQKESVKKPLLKNDSKFRKTTGDEAAGESRKRGKTTDIVIPKPVDKSSPKLAEPVIKAPIAKQPLPTPVLRPIDLPTPVHRPIALPAAQGAAQTETVGGVRSADVNPPAQYNPTEITIKKSNNFAGTPLGPQAKEPGKVEFPNLTAPPAAPSAGYDGQPVPTYNLQNAWPKKVESAPRPVVQRPPAPAPAMPSKVEGISIKQTIRR